MLGGAWRGAEGARWPARSTTPALAWQDARPGLARWSKSVLWLVGNRKRTRAASHRHRCLMRGKSRATSLRNGGVAGVAGRAAECQVPTRPRQDGDVAPAPPRTCICMGTPPGRLIAYRCCTAGSRGPSCLWFRLPSVGLPLPYPNNGKTVVSTLHGRFFRLCSRSPHAWIGLKRASVCV